MLNVIKNKIMMGGKNMMVI